MNWNDPSVLAFAGAAALLTLTLGADTMLVMRNVMRRGWQAGILTTLGINCGLFIHALLSSLGLSFILLHSAWAFNIVKWIGAGYLVFLGIQSLSHRSNSFIASQSMTPDTLNGTRVKGQRSYWEGFFSNVLNPKVAIFYLAFLPQFINPGDPIVIKSLFLAMIHVLMGLLWLSVVSFFLGRVQVFLSTPKVSRGIELTSGTILVLFGLRLAIERR